MLYFVWLLVIPGYCLSVRSRFLCRTQVSLFLFASVSPVSKLTVVRIACLHFYKYFMVDLWPSLWYSSACALHSAMEYLFLFSHVMLSWAHLYALRDSYWFPMSTVSDVCLVDWTVGLPKEKLLLCAIMFRTTRRAFPVFIDVSLIHFIAPHCWKRCYLVCAIWMPKSSHSIKYPCVFWSGLLGQSVL